MNNPHQLYTNGTDLFRISKYVPPTESVKGYFILSRGERGCEATLDELLTKWKVFNAHAAFADYLLYTDEHLKGVFYDDTHRHMMMWTKGRCLEVGTIWATPITYSDLLGYF